jgi:hypothetical protein
MYDFTYLDVINYIKNNHNKEWLTGSQNDCYGRLKELLEYNDVVNLYGPSGVGKTFLAWLFVKEGFNYFCNTKKFLKSDNFNKINAIIDKGTVMDTKSVRVLTMPKAKKVIYISEKKSLEYGVELKLDSEDISTVKKNLNIKTELYDYANIWDMLKRGYTYDNK